LRGFKEFHGPQGHNVTRREDNSTDATRQPGGPRESQKGMRGLPNNLKNRRTEMVETIDWRVACKTGVNTSTLGMKSFESRKAADKAASKLQALSDDAGFSVIYYAEPITGDDVGEDANEAAA
jgi:hypothetical protein